MSALLISGAVLAALALLLTVGVGDRARGTNPPMHHHLIRGGRGEGLARVLRPVAVRRADNEGWAMSSIGSNADHLLALRLRLRDAILASDPLFESRLSRTPHRRDRVTR